MGTMNHKNSKSPSDPGRFDGGRTNRVVSNDAMTQADWYAFVEKYGRTPGDYYSIFDDSLGGVEVES